MTSGRDLQFKAGDWRMGEGDNWEAVGEARGTVGDTGDSEGYLGAAGVGAGGFPSGKLRTPGHPSKAVKKGKGVCGGGGGLDAGGVGSRGDPKNWRYMVLAGSWFGVRWERPPAGLVCPWSP